MDHAFLGGEHTVELTVTYVNWDLLRELAAQQLRCGKCWQSLLEVDRQIDQLLACGFGYNLFCFGPC